MKFQLSAELYMIAAMSLNALTNPALGPTTAVLPLLGFMGGVVKRLIR